MKKTLFLLIIASFFLACPSEALQVMDSPLVTAQRTAHQGCVLSVNALSVPFEELLRDFARLCQVSITRRGATHLLQSTTIAFEELPLEQALKKLLRSAGIHNYLIRYSVRKPGHSLITEIVILGGCANAETPETAINLPAWSEQSGAVVHPVQPPSALDTFSEKLASFKERYVWESEEMLNRAVYLIKAMPDEVKASALEGIMKELDSISVDRKGAIGEELFYQAIEAAAPPGMAPVMMKQVRRLSEGYHNGD